MKTTKMHIWLLNYQSLTSTGLPTGSGLLFIIRRFWWTRLLTVMSSESSDVQRNNSHVYQCCITCSFNQVFLRAPKISKHLRLITLNLGVHWNLHYLSLLLAEEHCFGYYMSCALALLFCTDESVSLRCMLCSWLQMITLSVQMSWTTSKLS